MKIFIYNSCSIYTYIRGDIAGSCWFKLQMRTGQILNETQQIPLSTGPMKLPNNWQAIFDGTVRGEERKRGRRDAADWQKLMPRAGRNTNRYIHTHTHIWLMDSVTKAGLSGQKEQQWAPKKMKRNESKQKAQTDVTRPHEIKWH